MKLLRSITYKKIYIFCYLLVAAWIFGGVLRWLVGGMFYLTDACAAVAVFGAYALCLRYLAALNERMAAVDSFLWDIELNQVKVGTISDAEYAAIRHQCFSDLGVYVDQLKNVLHVGFVALNLVLRAVPIGLFWMFVGFAIFSPETITMVLATLQKAGPQEIQNVFFSAARVAAILMLMLFTVNSYLGYWRFGFVNRFDEAVSTRLRKHCQVAAEGSIALVGWIDGVLHFGDEMAYIQSKKQGAN